MTQLDQATGKSQKEIPDENGASKPRVMEIITRLVRGGAQEVTLLITRRLLREGYPVVLAHGPGDGSTIERLARDHPNLEILYIPEFRRRILPVHDLIALVRLVRYLKTHPVQLVHTHTSKAGMIGRWAARLAGVPVIIHSPRGSIFHPVYFGRPMLWFFSFMEKITAAFTDKILTLCESERQDYLARSIAPAEKITTLYSGVEVDRYRAVRVDVERKKAELGIPAGRPVLGYAARFAPEKGHELCLSVFRKVAERIPEAVLVLAGEGPLEAMVRRRVLEFSLEDKVVMIGYRLDLAEVLQIFDCFIQPSIWDGLPRAMIEAMLGQKPVVATAVGGIPEIIHHGKTGMLVPAGDIEGLAAAVVEIFCDPEIGRALGRNARRRVEEVADIDASVEKLFSLYESLLWEKSEAMPRPSTA